MSMNAVTLEDNTVFACSVTKPEHQGSGRSKVTDFLVTSTFPNAESLVRRRYEDFEWVQNRLVEERTGIIVPVLPTKTPTRDQKFSEEFVEECRDVLDRFLQRVIKHQELVDAPSLLAFFTANPADWKSAKEVSKKLDKVEAVERSLSNLSNPEDPNTIVIDAEASAPQKKPGRFGKWMAAKKEKWALRNKNLVLEELPAESKKFQDLADYADHLETCARILSEDCKGLVDAIEAQSEKFKTMGAAYAQLWGEHELSNTSTSAMYQEIGECWGGVSVQMLEQRGYTKREVDTALEELVLDIVALKDALEKRKAVLYKYTKNMQEGRTLDQQLDKLKATDDLSQHADRFHSLEKAAQANHIQCAEGKKHCELISLRLDRDVERFRVEWHERMRQILQKFHQAQGKFLQQQAKQFMKALPSLSEIDYSHANLPTSQTVSKPELQVSYNSRGASVSFGGEGEGSSIEPPPSPIAGPPAAAPPPPPHSMSPKVAPPAAAPPPPESVAQSISIDSSFGSVDLESPMGGETPQVKAETTLEGREAATEEPEADKRPIVQSI